MVRMMKPPFSSGRKELLQLLAQVLALFLVLDALGDADMRFLRQINEEAPGDADLRGQPGAFGADRIFHDLHDEILPFREQSLDGRGGARAPVILPVAPDVRDVQKRRALAADLDESRLHARQHANDASHIDVTHEPARGSALDVQLVGRAVLDHCDARLLRRHVDENFLGHGKARPRIGHGVLLHSNVIVHICVPANAYRSIEGC